MFSSNTSQVSTGGYQISRSLRFNSADSAYLNRTPASASNLKTWTWSAWVKLCNTTPLIALFSAGDTSGNRTYLYYYGNLQFRTVSGGTGYALETTATYRDPSAWYHIVISFDTTQATSSDRMKIWINGVQVTSFGTATYPPQNTDGFVNSTASHTMGRFSNTASDYGNNYLTEVNFIDGQALTPSSFGYYDSNTGVWTPTKFVGTYGTNGFYLNFSDNSNTTAATLGKDYSGNGNNWTPNNFSVTAGAGNDSLVDSPTSYGTDTGVGGNVRGNYCTWNPLDINTGATYTTYANGNLDCTATGYKSAFATIAVTSGKWYWEVVPTGNTGSVNYMIGIADANTPISTRVATGANVWLYFYNGNKFNNGSGTSYGASYTTNDVIGVALDMDAGTVTFYKNGTSQGVAYNTLSGKAIQPAVSDGSSVHTMNYTGNFGQRPFAYTAPSGYKALCTQNLPTPTIGATTATQAGKYFNPVLYTGNGGTQTVTGVNFQPDLVWIKSRSNAYDHDLFDVLRGTGKWLGSNSTAAEVNVGGEFSAFTSDGFTVTNGASIADNANGATYVAWNWKANGSGSTNTAGSITSTVSANTTSGFSISTFTGNGTAGATVGHGLGVAPSMIIVKSIGNARNWLVYHASIGATKFVQLDTTIAATTATTPWNDTAPTSTVFTLGTSAAGNESGVTRVAYCFAEVAGYSKFTSWTGNGSADGPFIFTGFRPAYVMVKLSSTGGEGWWVFDNKRNAYNVTNSILSPNSSGAEITGDYGIDMVSNGFKIRNAQAFINGSGNTYICAAFAESPFKYSLAR